MATAAVLPNSSAVERVSSLPLVSSTYGLVSSVYASTKHTHPYLRSVCEAAEQGVRSLGAVVFVTASPIIHRLEPQIAVANDLACKGLDRIEKTLPILHQPPEQIVSSAKVVVSSAKDTVSDTLSSAVERTRGAVRGGVEKTRNVVLESLVVQLVSSGVDTALSTSESLVDQYLPVTEEELELEAQSLNGLNAAAAPTYYVRLGCLSVRLRTRTYSRAASTIQRSRQLMRELQSPAELIQYGRKNIQGANEKLSSLWRSSPNPEPGHDAEVIESRTLALARSLSQQLQTSCLALVSSLQGLPTSIQQEALLLSHSASQGYLRRAPRLSQLPDGVLSASRVRLERIRESLDDVMDYMVNNTPLNWLVGPFYPRMVAMETPTASPPSSPSTPREAEVEAEVEAEMESPPPQEDS